MTPDAIPAVIIDLARAQQVRIGAAEYHVPLKEAQILQAILTLPKPVRRESLMQAVWPAGIPHHSSLSVQLVRIRNFLALFGLTIRYTNEAGYELDRAFRG